MKRISSPNLLLLTLVKHWGAVSYLKQGDRILRTNSAAFGPGDLYCSMWGLLALTGLGEAEWTPQYNYWQRPEQLDDGGENLID